MVGTGTHAAPKAHVFASVALSAEKLAVHPPGFSSISNTVFHLRHCASYVLLKEIGKHVQPCYPQTADIT